VPGVRRIPPPAWRQRRTAAAAAGALVLLVAGVLVAVAAFGGDDEPSSVASSVEVVTVPAVVGLRTSAAEAALRRAGLGSAVERRANARASGTVIAAKPQAGSRVERGVAILLVVSSGRAAGGGTTTTTTTETGPGPSTTTAPTVTERPGDTVIVEPEPSLSEVPGVLDVGFVDSARMVEDRGYVADTYPVASGKPRGTVVRQQPAAGTALARGRTVRLYVAVGRGSRGAVTLTDFSGLPERQARELIERAGLTVRTVDRAAPSPKDVGRVLRQQPGAPKRLRVLSQVTIYVGR
jgi:beta-lactam-binding protein with PASTA domain